VELEEYQKKFAAFYKSINTSGQMDDFFHDPENFAYLSNDFGATKLILQNLAGKLPTEAGKTVEAAIKLCGQALDESVDTIKLEHPEWSLILGLLEIIKNCAR